ncbi:hypothetical protein GCM10009560_36730 [Nonomuraea longicatena]|uniref:Integrase n=1 Tax=Nonomuraea longicatena TaxID=83682 RepID=A0ABP4A8C3_9ACTN
MVRLAQALRLSDLSSLTGDPVSIPADAIGKRSHPAVSEIRAALHGASLPSTPSLAPVTPEALKARVDSAWRLWHNSTHRRTEVGSLLPGLLHDAEVCIRAWPG